MVGICNVETSSVLSFQQEYGKESGSIQGFKLNKGNYDN